MAEHLPSVVIDNLDAVGISVSPFEAYSPLLVDADAELTFAVAGQSL
jgi:hypothetical protein